MKEKALLQFGKRAFNISAKKELRGVIHGVCFL